MDEIEEQPTEPAHKSRPWWMRLSVWAAVIVLSSIVIHSVFHIPSGTVLGALILGAPSTVPLGI